MTTMLYMSTRASRFLVEAMIKGYVSIELEMAYFLGGTFRHPPTTDEVVRNRIVLYYPSWVNKLYGWSLDPR